MILIKAYKQFLIMLWLTTFPPVRIWFLLVPFVFLVITPASNLRDAVLRVLTYYVVMLGITLIAFVVYVVIMRRKYKEM